MTIRTAQSLWCAPPLTAPMLSGCKQPPVKVKVVTREMRGVTLRYVSVLLRSERLGRTQTHLVGEVQPQVSGIVIKPVHKMYGGDESASALSDQSGNLRGQTRHGRSANRREERRCYRPSNLGNI